MSFIDIRINFYNIITYIIISNRNHNYSVSKIKHTYENWSYLSLSWSNISSPFVATQLYALVIIALAPSFIVE